MSRIAEYGSLTTSDFAVETVIREENRRSDYGTVRRWKLSHRTAGYVCAGACARYEENAVYRVTCFIDNATHGQAFLSLEAAEIWLSTIGEIVP